MMEEDNAAKSKKVQLMNLTANEQKGAKRKSDDLINQRHQEKHQLKKNTVNKRRRKKHVSKKNERRLNDNKVASRRQKTNGKHHAGNKKAIEERILQTQQNKDALVDELMQNSEETLSSFLDVARQHDPNSSKNHLFVCFFQT